MAKRSFILWIAPLLAASLAGCGGRRADWPTLAPRAGEVSTMVPRNVVEAGRCPSPADCAPPASPIVAATDKLPPVPQPNRAEADAELAAISAIIDQVEVAARGLRAVRTDTLRAATGRKTDSAEAARAEAAKSALSATLTPLSGAAFRLQALDLATRTAADRAAYADRITAMIARIGALDDR